MDGYSVLKSLKNKEVTKDIPIIFISSLDDEADEEKGLLLGAADYITKPFSPIIVKLRVRLQMHIRNQFKTIIHLSMTDNLINIPNRKYFDRRLQEEWDRGFRNNEAVGLMIVDIDVFHVYNEKYGHKQGNAALISVAKTLSGTLVRPGDFVARWGGDSFSILMPEAYETGVARIAERIRKSVEETAMLNEQGEETFVKVSIGTNVENPVSGKTLDKFISQTNTALARAKEYGRNRVVAHG